MFVDWDLGPIMHILLSNNPGEFTRLGATTPMPATAAAIATVAARAALPENANAPWEGGPTRMARGLAGGGAHAFLARPERRGPPLSSDPDPIRFLFGKNICQHLVTANKPADKESVLACLRLCNHPETADEVERLDGLDDGAFIDECNAFVKAVAEDASDESFDFKLFRAGEHGACESFSKSSGQTGAIMRLLREVDALRADVPEADAAS
jgi:hypothetical protein